MLGDRLGKEEFGRKRLVSITEELEKQKSEMEAEIHVLLDIEAEKSRSVNALEFQLRSSEATEKSLHDKLAVLTEDFASLEEHIAVLKERLISTDTSNERLDGSLRSAQFQLQERDSAAVAQKDLEVKLRKELEASQAREARRERQIEELIIENERLTGEVNHNRHRLQDRSRAPISV